MRIIIFYMFMLISIPVTAHAQEATDDNTAAEVQEGGNFINYGSIEISTTYTLTDDEKHIVFEIKNNTANIIDLVFGWVYRIERGEKGGTTNSVLINNPHASGTLVSKYPHNPSAIGSWRFTFNKKPSEQNTYVLKVNTKSIFYNTFRIKEPLVAQLEEEGEKEKKDETVKNQ